MYIATFYTHFGAQSFYASVKKQDPAARMMPVPRALSASCGICVSFEADLTDQITADHPEDLEGLYRTEGKRYETILEVEE
ncbi:MAG: DUF3343 domain-containing protein [Mogibacterium sp.]|nr:DUF3343 domain-containing protein [Mogibacterium sp.]